MEGSESSVEFCRLSALPRDEKDRVLEEATHRFGGGGSASGRRGLDTVDRV